MKVADIFHFTVFLVAVTVAANCCAAPLEVDVVWQTVRQVQGIRVRTAGDDKPLMQPNGQPLLTPSKCQTTLQMEPASNGFDLLLTVINPTDQPQPRPALNLTGIGLGRKTTHLDARNVGTWRQRNAAGKTSMWSSRLNYPDDLYAPVLVIRDERFAISISVIYDVLHAKHGIATFWGAEGGAYRGTYKVNLELQLRKNKTATNRILPGAVQRYRIAVRFARPQAWQKTLEPYRQYFQKTYGPVQYQADKRTVWGQALAYSELLDRNDRGYSPQWRTDLHGWKPAVNAIFRYPIARGYQRVMLWNPQGMYRIGENFPCEFMTQWPRPMVASTYELRRLHQAHVTLGLWWGRSSQVSGGFNSGRMWLRDITNSDDVAAGDRELELAVTRGVKEVGLDAFINIPLWDRYIWLKRIGQRYPSLRFITEPADCDIMHTLAPTFCIWQKQNQPPHLANLLNPGHETWVMLRSSEVSRESFNKIRRWGMVPVTMARALRH